MRLRFQLGAGHMRGSGAIVLSPCPVHAGIGVVLGLPRDEVALIEQELLTGVVLEVIGPSQVDHA